VLVGRSATIAAVTGLAHQLANSRGTPMVAITGLAGMGVTSTLHELADRLTTQRWGTAVVNAREITDQRSVRSVLADGLDDAVDTLDKRGHLERRMPQLRGMIHEFRTGSGGLALDTLEALRELGQALNAHQGGIMVMVDDAHRLGTDLPVLAAVAGASAERGSPATLLLGGLPQPMPQLEVLDIGPLTGEQVDDAIVGTASELEVMVHPDAIARIVSISRGVPFMVQTFAHHAWNASEGSPILADAVDRGLSEARGDMMSIWYAERVESVDATQRRYLSAVKELGSHHVPLDQVARRVGDTTRLDGTSSTSATLAALAHHGLVCRGNDHTVGFALPAFDRFIEAHW